MVFGVAANFGKLLQSLPVAPNGLKLNSKCVSSILMHQETMELVNASNNQLHQFAANLRFFLQQMLQERGDPAIFHHF